jgi:hypothetical protein
MAVLVKPNGLLGSGYMAALRPFRHLIVYPALIRQTGRAWQALTAGPPTSAHAPHTAEHRITTGAPAKKCGACSRTSNTGPR